MARNYEVILDAPTTGYIYADDYFPRGFHYFSQANDLVAEVEGRGGKAHVENLKARKQALLENMD